jgi:hypothetical protein
VANVADRSRQDVGRQDNRNREREEPEEELRKLDRSAPDLHDPDDDARRYVGGLVGV